MSLTFDITRAPPSPADIAAERAQAVEGRAAIQKKNVRFMIVAVAVGLSLLAFQWFVGIPAVKNADANPTTVGVIALYTPYIIGVFFFTTLTLHHRLIEKPRTALGAALTSLQEATPDELAKIADAQQHEIMAYRAQVAAQGRELLRAEVEGIRRWLDKQRPPAE